MSPMHGEATDIAIKGGRHRVSPNKVSLDGHRQSSQNHLIRVIFLLFKPCVFIYPLSRLPTLSCVTSVVLGFPRLLSFLFLVSLFIVFFQVLRFQLRLCSQHNLNLKFSTGSKSCLSQLPLSFEPYIWVQLHPASHTASYDHYGNQTSSSNR